MGDFDLFVSRRLHSDTFWGIPENLGYPINSHNTEKNIRGRSKKQPKVIEKEPSEEEEDEE